MQELERVVFTLLPRKTEDFQFDENEYIQCSLDSAKSYLQEDDYERAFLYFALAYYMIEDTQRDAYGVIKVSFSDTRDLCYQMMEDLRNLLIPLYASPLPCRCWLSFDRDVPRNNQPVPMNDVNWVTGL